MAEATYIVATVPNNTSITDTVYVSLRGMSGTYTGGQRTLAWEFNGTAMATETLGNSDVNTPDKTIRGLTAGTTYTIVAHVYVHNGSIEYWDSYFTKFQNGTTAQITTNSATPTITPFSWTASAQTRAAYSAVTNKTATENFSHLVWNDMVDKVKEIFDANGWSWDNYYATYNNTRMTSSPYTLTAVKFNSLRNNIDFHNNTGIGKVNKDDPVKGSYFTTLVTKINGMI